MNFQEIPLKIRPLFHQLIKGSSEDFTALGGSAESG
jgi:hypothetical protein